jgi:protease-4
MAQQAQKAGLVDQLAYEDQVYAELKRKAGSGDLHKVSLADYARTVTGRGDKIAYLVGQGDIIRGSQNGNYNSNQVLSVAEMAKAIRQVRNDSSIKGVIVRVDSPGGDAVASDEILHELKLLSGAKPVVISMSDLAASGGYFISMTGDPVISYPNTITGSIGVLYVRPNFHDLYDKLGLREDMLTRGKLADIDSVYQPMSDAARQKLHESIQTTYNSFVSKVAAARKRSFEQIDALAQGRVWMGEQARQNGLVDELGGLDLAVSMIRNKARLSPQGETNLIPFPPKRSILELLTDSSSDSFARVAAEEQIRGALPDLPGPSLLHGGLLRVLPYRFSVQ